MPQGVIATVVIDDVEVRALEGSVVTRLNGIGTATCKLAMTEAIGGAGSMLKVYLENTDLGPGPTLWHHGRVLTCEDSADENGGYTVYNSSDPLELWAWRPVRDHTGDFTAPTIITDEVTGPQIIHAMLEYSNGNTRTPPFDDLAEGPLRLKYDNTHFETAGANLSGTPTDWPMTMAQIASLLVSTGAVDIVVKPIEYDGDNNYGEIWVANGKYGNDLSGSVFFQYGMGAYNIRALRRNEDMSRIVNKLWYYLGPPKDQQHWTANITATQDFMVDFGDPGGMPEVNPSPCPYDASSPSPYDVDLVQVRQAILDSRAEEGDATTLPPDPFGDSIFNPGTPGSYDVRMEVRTYDDRNDEVQLGYCLFKRQWLNEQWLRLAPLTLVHITPTRDTGIGTFDIGDLITVEACADVRTGFSGVQRIYEYTVNWDQDSVPAIQELQVSSDNEGFPSG